MIDENNNELERSQVVFIYKIDFSDKSCEILIEKTPWVDSG